MNKSLNNFNSPEELAEWATRLKNDDSLPHAFSKARFNNPLIYKMVEQGASNIEIIVALNEQVDRLQEQLMMLERYRPASISDYYPKNFHD
jgi:hypothetical protein